MNDFFKKILVELDYFYLDQKQILFLDPHHKKLIIFQCIFLNLILNHPKIMRKFVLNLAIFLQEKI
jgi:hypothetical protein